MIVNEKLSSNKSVLFFVVNGVVYTNEDCSIGIGGGDVYHNYISNNSEEIEYNANTDHVTVWNKLKRLVDSNLQFNKIPRGRVVYTEIIKNGKIESSYYTVYLSSALKPVIPSVLRQLKLPNNSKIKFADHLYSIS